MTEKKTMDSHERPKSSTALAVLLTEAAARAMAAIDDAPATERFVRHYRDDARLITAAVLLQLAGTPRRRGIFPKSSPEAQVLLVIARQLQESPSGWAVNGPALTAHGSAPLVCSGLIPRQ